MKRKVANLSTLAKRQCKYQQETLEVNNQQIDRI